MTAGSLDSNVISAVSDAWRAELRCDVEPSSEFFDLGGDSLQAIELIGRINETLGVDVPLRTVFEHSTLEDFMVVVGAMCEDGPRPADVPHEGSQELDRPDFDCSISQTQRLRLQPDGAIHCNAFNVSQLYRVRGQLDHRILKAAVGSVIERHDALRVRFFLDRGALRQRILSAESASTDLIDVSGAESNGQRDEARVTEARLRLELLVDEPFDLRSEVLRIAIAQLDRDDHFLLFCFSHAICDGHSMAIITSDLAAIYEGVSLGREPRLPPSNVSWREWVEAEREWVEGAAGQTAIEYWRQKLAGSSPIPEIRLPEEVPVAADWKASAAAELAAVIVADDVRRLEEIGRKEKATLYMILLALLAEVVSEAVGSPDVGIVSPFANRTRATRNLVGWLSFTVPLRLDLRSGTNFSQRLAQVRATLLEAQEHAVPRPVLIRDLAPELAGSAQRRPTAYLQFMTETAPDLRLPALTSEPLGPPNESWTHPGLYWFITKTPVGLQIVMRYEADVISEPVAESLVGRFTAHAAALVVSLEA